MKKHAKTIFLLSVLYLLVLPAWSQKAFRLRTLTAGVNLSRDNHTKSLDATMVFLKTGIEILADAGFTLQSVRLATNPFPVYTRGLDLDETFSLIKSISDTTAAQEVGLSIGPAIMDNIYDRAIVEKICLILKGTNANSSIVIASQEQGIHFDAVKAAAETISILAEIDTMANFRFAAIANVPAETPFFPAAYHNRGYNSFTIGTESASLIRDIAVKAHNFLQARERLITAFAKESRVLLQAARRIQQESGWRFEGVDLSPAPMGEISIGGAIEALSGRPFGAPGTLNACSLITDVLKTVKIPRAGYCGLMLPVMEDAILARRAAEGWFDLNELLGYSAVCGTGLDVIPLPGDASREDLESILLDAAALSLKLDKPLSVRLIPVKGKQAGEEVILESPYLVPARVMPIK